MSILKAIILSVIVVLCAFIANAQNRITQSFYFETDSAVLNTIQSDLFVQFVKELVPSEVISVDVFGYCDDRGRKTYNDTLSIKRAQFIFHLLVNKGIMSEKIKMISGKGSVLLANNNDIQGQRAQNRRVDIVIDYLPKIIRPNQNIIPDNLEVGDKILLEDVLFENSRSVLLQESIPVLEKITAIVKEKKQYNFVILGHICCNPPNVDVIDLETGERNLSTARAKLIYDYFIYRGINKKRLTYKGMMANFPLGKGDKYDRRVELQVVEVNTIKK